jgi:hypothetical protein
MARARNIKPAFFKNEFLAELSPYARLLYIGLWTIVDREGRLEDRPLRIKGELFPYESVDIETLLNELASSSERFIVRYEADGKKCIWIPTFKKHQNPHRNEGESELPAYSEKISNSSGKGSSDSEKISSDSEKNPSAREKDRTAPAESLILNPESLTQKSVRVCDSKYGDIAKQGFEYLRDLELPNLNLSGLEKRLAFEFDKQHKLHQHLKQEHLLECWMASCDVLRGKQDISSLNYVFNTFSSKLAAFEPAKASVRPQAKAPKQEHWKIISQSKRAVNIWDGSVIDGTQYVYDCLSGPDARLKHKTTGETIRCGDYRSESG